MSTYRENAASPVSPSLETLEIELGLEQEGTRLGRRGAASHEGDPITASFRGGPSLLARSDKTRPFGLRRCCTRGMVLRVGLGAGFVVLLVALLSCLSRSEPEQRSVKSVCSVNVTRGAGISSVRNVVFMIPDGMGPAYLNLTRAALSALGKGDTKLALDDIEYGRIHTRSRDNNTTDSAAAATAYATGHRTDNLHLSMLDGQPIPTVLEGAEAAGMWTGLVTTARITHATPAGFSAHVDDRDDENTIAEQQLEQGIEVLMGGGRRHFVPAHERGSKREDSKNMEKYAQGKGYNVIHTADELASAQLPVLGLFSDSHLAFEMDREQRRTEQPSLAAMARRALQLLSSAPDGFFLMIEGGRIDHAGHYNDPVAAFHEVLAYDAAVQEVLDFAAWDLNTLIISAADHETGGLFQGETMQPDYAAMVGVTSSAEMLAADISVGVEAAGGDGEAEVSAVRRAFTKAGANATRLTSFAATTIASRADEVDMEYLAGGLPLLLGRTLSEMLSVGWTSAHHTPVDITLAAAGPHATNLPAVMDNSALGKEVIDALGVEPERGYSFTHRTSNSDCNLA